MQAYGLQAKAGWPIFGCHLVFLPREIYAVIEFRSKKEATSGLTLDGIKLQGHTLKIRRPPSYQPHHLPQSTIRQRENLVLPSKMMDLSKKGYPNEMMGPPRGISPSTMPSHKMMEPPRIMNSLKRMMPIHETMVPPKMIPPHEMMNFPRIMTVPKMMPPQEMVGPSRQIVSPWIIPPHEMMDFPRMMPSYEMMGPPRNMDPYNAMALPKAAAPSIYTPHFSRNERFY